MKIFIRQTLPYVLFVLVALSLSLRLTGINSKLPYSCIFGDEQIVIQSAMEIWESMIPQALGWPATPYLFLLAVSYLIFFSLQNILLILSAIGGEWMPLLRQTNSFFIEFYNDPSAQYLIARGWSFVFGIGSAFILYLITQRLYDRKLGVLSALCLLFCPLHVYFSRIATTDATMVFFVTLTIFYSSSWMLPQNSKSYRGAGISAGLALACKYNGAISYLLILLYHKLSGERKEIWSWKGFLGQRFVKSILLSLGIFYIFNPYILTAPSVSAKEIFFTAGLVTIFDPKQISAVSMKTLGKILIPSFGFPFLILSAVGVIIILFRMDKKAFPLVLTSLFYFLVFIGSRRQLDRYLLPLAPFISIFSAYGFFWIFRNVSSRLKESGRVLVLLMTVPFFIPTVKKIAHDARSLYEPVPSVIAKNWIEQHIPEGSRIALQDLAVPLNRNAISLSRSLRFMKNKRKIINQKASIIANLDPYPVAVFSNIILNDENMLERKFDFLYWQMIHQPLKGPLYDIVDFNDSVYFLAARSKEIFEKVRWKEFDYVISSNSIDGFGELVETWENIHLYRMK